VNTTSFCNSTPNVGYIFTVEIIVIDTFPFEIEDVGIEWIKLNWTDSPGVTAQYSFDNLTWMNISTVTRTIGFQYALPTMTLVYLRAKNASTNYEYRADVTEPGGEPMMAYATIGLIMIGITFLFAWFAARAKSIAIQMGLSLITIVMVVFDFFMSARIMEAVDSSQVGLIGYLDTFYGVAVMIMQFVMWAVLIFILWFIYKLLKDAPRRKREAKEEDYLFD